MRKLIGFLMMLVLVVSLASGCAGPHPVRRATVGSAKAVGKGTVWVAKKTGQGVVYVAKSSTNAVKSIGGGKKSSLDAEPDTLVHVGDKPLTDGTANLVEQEVAERESGEFDMSDDTRTASKSSAEMPVSSPTRSSSSSGSGSGWSTKGASDDGMLAADDPGDLAFSGGGNTSSSRGAATAMPATPSGEIRYDLPELDIDATLAAAEGRSTKK